MSASGQRAIRTSAVALGLIAAWLSGQVASAAPVAPVSFVTMNDAVTGDAPNFFLNHEGKRRWVVDAGADSYQNDFYERPTTEQFIYESILGSPATMIYGAKEYIEYIDIKQGKAGFDSQYLYISIKMFGRDDETDGTQPTDSVTKGLVERYGFRIGGSLDDPQSRGGYLMTADNPETKSGPNTVFAPIGTFGWHDTNFDVGGTGISVTKEDREEEVQGNGYETVVIGDGMIKSGVHENEVALYTRLDPNDPTQTTVEFALDYGLLGLTTAQVANLGYLEFEAIKGGPKDRATYVWNDEYNKTEAGSPYHGSGDLSEFGTQGLENIYELDTLRVGTIPEPSAAVAFLAIGAGAISRRRSRD